MMRATRSRTAQPLRGDVTHSAMGAWGFGLTVVVLVMFFAGLATAALYLETGSPRQDGTAGPTGAGWPPGPIGIPSARPALVSVVLIAVGSVGLVLATSRLGRGSAQPAGLFVLASVGAWVASALVLTSDLGRLGFAWDEHAYTSVYWTFTIAVIVFTGIEALMAFSVLVQLVVGVVDSERHLELIVIAGFGWVVLATAVLLLGLVHLLPVVGGGG